MVEFVRVEPGAQSVKLGINKTWIGKVRHFDGLTTDVYLKDLPRKELANELVGAAFARGLGLPTPEVYLAVASVDDLDASELNVSEDDHLVFASKTQSTPPLFQVWKANKMADSLLQKLGDWSHCGGALAFDTWIANVDRHTNNLLFDGSAEVSLIDHGLCLTSDVWVPSDLVPDREYRNRLTEWLTDALSPKQRKRLMDDVSDFPSKATNLNIDDIISASGASSLLDEDELGAVVGFLTQRVVHVPRIGTKQAGLPRLL